jgi:hypothetical protein
MQYIVLLLDSYTFYDTTKIIAERITRRRKMTHHEEISYETMQLWDVAHIKDEDFGE